MIQFFTNMLATGGVVVGFLLVFLESFISILPLSVFVAFNINAFGFLVGFIISWLGTCLGSFLCYLIFFFMEERVFTFLFRGKVIKKIRSGIYSFQNISFSKLVLIITLPFTPSFLVNIICGVGRVSYKKFLASLLIGKIFVIIFWGYIGKTFIDSLTDVYSLIYIIFSLGIAYIISDCVGKKMNIK